MLRFSSVSDGADGRTSGGQRVLYRSEMSPPNDCLYRQSPYHPRPGDPPHENRKRRPIAECEGGAGWFRIRDPGVLGGGLEVPDARRVLAEDLRLDLWRQLWIAVAFDQLVWDLELPEGVDLPLRIAPETRVGPPHDVIRAEVAEQRPQHVRALHRPAGHRRRERRADFRVQVGTLRLEHL